MTYGQIVEKVLKPALDLGTRFIAFSGGEFLLREDAFKLLSKADKLGYGISIISNGTTLSTHIIKKLVSLLGDNLQVSLGINSFDFENKNTRDKTVDFTMKKINLLRKHGVKVNLSIAIGKFNEDSFDTTVEQIKSLGLPFNRIPFVIRNCENPELMYDSEAMKNKFHPTLRKHFNGCVSYTPFFLDPNVYEKESGQNEETNKVPTNPSVGCWCGSFYAINAEGDVSICPLLLDHVKAGNVFEDGLKSILWESDLFKKVLDRNTLSGECGACQFRFTCGGCRAMAYYHNGELFGSDPTCFLGQLNQSELEVMKSETEGSFRNYIRMAGVGNAYTIPEMK